MLKKGEVNSSWTNIFNFIKPKIVPTLSFLGMSSLVGIILLIVCPIFNVSPFHYFHDLSFQEREHKFQEQEQETKLRDKILKREYIDFHNDLGIHLLFVEQLDAAKNEFNEVLKVDPLNQNATRGLFECSVFNEVQNDSRDLEVTNKQLTALSKDNPNDPLPNLYLGDLAFALHQNNISQLADAERFYKNATSLNNSTVAAYAGLGSIYNEQNKIDDAIEIV